MYHKFLHVIVPPTWASPCGNFCGSTGFTDFAPSDLSSLLYNDSSASIIDLSPVISAKYCDMSSNALPFVSGKIMYIHTKMTKHTTESIMKKPAHDIVLATERNVDAIKVAVTLFMNVLSYK